MVAELKMQNNEFDLSRLQEENIERLQRRVLEVEMELSEASNKNKFIENEINEVDALKQENQQLNDKMLHHAKLAKKCDALKDQLDTLKSSHALELDAKDACLQKLQVSYSKLYDDLQSSKTEAQSLRLTFEKQSQDVEALKQQKTEMELGYQLAIQDLKQQLEKLSGRRLLI